MNKKNFSCIGQSTTLANKEISEDLAEIGIIWLVIKSEGPTVLEVGAKLQGEASAEKFDWRCHLLLTDLLVLVLLGSRFQPLQANSVSGKCLPQGNERALISCL